MLRGGRLQNEPGHRGDYVVAICGAGLERGSWGAEAREACLIWNCPRAQRASITGSRMMKSKGGGSLTRTSC